VGSVSVPLYQRHTHPHLDWVPGAPVVGSLCSGYGDLGLAATVSGVEVAWVADPDPDITRLLAARYPDVPNLGDITTPDWAGVPSVDVITAGFPCQDILAWPARTGGCGAADAAGRRRRTRRDRPGEQSGGSASGEPHRRRHPADHPARGPGAGAGLVGVAAA